MLPPAFTMIGDDKHTVPSGGWAQTIGPYTPVGLACFSGPFPAYPCSNQYGGRPCGPRAGQSDLTRSAAYPLVVDRPIARASAWYEMMPRSQSAVFGKHGTFDDCINRLPDIAAMGFDVLYLTPIHPIGRVNRKGRNNSLRYEPGDPGSPYAIGSAEGGDDAVHPELGTLDDFRRFVRACAEHRLEVALDFAVQCSPDHPWLVQYPEWFRRRPDGSIQYSENPPKKYEDIVNPDLTRYNAVAVAAALTKAGPREFCFHFGDIEIGPSTSRRHVKLIENLVTGERHVLEWGGVRLRIDQQQDPVLLFRCLT